jgi:hypothetical protein
MIAALILMVLADVTPYADRYSFQKFSPVSDALDLRHAAARGQTRARS